VLGRLPINTQSCKIIQVCTKLLVKLTKHTLLLTYCLLIILDANEVMIRELKNHKTIPFFFVLANANGTPGDVSD
jgi:hypothetical protein